MYHKSIKINNYIGTIIEVKGNTVTVKTGKTVRVVDKNTIRESNTPMYSYIHVPIANYSPLKTLSLPVKNNSVTQKDIDNAILAFNKFAYALSIIHKQELNLHTKQSMKLIQPLLKKGFVIGGFLKEGYRVITLSFNNKTIKFYKLRIKGE